MSLTSPQTPSTPFESTATFQVDGAEYINSSNCSTYIEHEHEQEDPTSPNSPAHMSSQPSTPNLTPDLSTSLDQLEKQQKSASPTTADLPTLTATSPFRGSGTVDDPYQVEFTENDPSDPLQWSKGAKWRFTAVLAIVTLCPIFASSAYASGIEDIMIKFPGTSQELAISGMSLYLVGLALGPLIWGPLSEIKGRRFAFNVSFPLFVIFNLGGVFAKNIETILITRFLAAAFGCAPVTNGGGQLSDVWAPEDRIVPGGLYTLAPLLGPVIGPIVSGYVAQSKGFRAVFYVQLGFGAVMFLLALIGLPESYAPTLLQRKAESLQKAARASGSEECFVSKYDLQKQTKKDIVKTAMVRPFQLLFQEVIVWTLSIYLALIYGILYLLFTAFPLIFQVYRGWSLGQTGLALIGIGIGMLFGTSINKLSVSRYARARANTPANLPVPPEIRLPLCCVGALLVPISLFVFAWTSTRNVHWIVPIIATIPFGAGYLLIFTAVMIYLIDSYSIHAASALAANTVVRSLFGAAFPLFGIQMYEKLNPNWAGTLLAFLSLACAPMPFLFYKYGPRLRKNSKYAPSGEAALLQDQSSPSAVKLPSSASTIHGDDQGTAKNESVTEVV